MFLHQSDPANPAFMPLEPTNTREFQAFVYATLDSETRAIVQQCTSEIKSLTKRTSVDSVRIGDNLLTVKQRLKYGQFGKWLEAEFGWSPKMAYRFINVYKCFSCVNLTKLDIAPSALYDLAEPATPEIARQEALQRARQGETITCSKAQKITDRHKYPPILPEVLPPEQATVSAQEEVTVPSITITIPAKAAFSPKPSVEERALLELQVRPDVKSEYHGQSDQEIAGNAETGSHDFSQGVTGLQPEPPIQVLNIDVDASKLQENILQVFEVVSSGIHIQFQALPGTAISLFQQLREFPTVAERYVA